MDENKRIQELECELKAKKAHDEMFEKAERTFAIKLVERIVFALVAMILVSFVTLLTKYAFLISG